MLKLVSVQRQLDTHAKLIGELECERDARVDADEYSGAVERLEDEQRAMQNLSELFETFKSEAEAAQDGDAERLLQKDQQLQDLQHELDELNETLVEKDVALAAATAGPGRGRPASTEESFMQMRADVGVFGHSTKVPAPQTYTRC